MNLAAVGLYVSGAQEGVVGNEVDLVGAVAQGLFDFVALAG
jgi:hypothetical protein